MVAAEFRAFVKTWLDKNIVAAPPDTDVTFATWLSRCIYPAWRKQALEDVHNQILDSGVSLRDAALPKGYADLKSFIKWEWYPTYKHARAINSRDDRFKVLVGPYFKIIEQQLYQHPAFIKKVPVKDRPQYVIDRLERPGCNYMVTDHSQYEAAFTSELMEDCEFQLYEHALKNLEGREAFMRHVRTYIAGEQLINFKHFTMNILATRMSGEMNTSSGNGFSNLMASEFAAYKSGTIDMIGVVEGDDGLNSYFGPQPEVKWFELNGFTIKLDQVSSIGDSSFCGFIFDEDDRVNLTDPIACIASFGWVNPRYLGAKHSIVQGLLRCKALSFLHQYPGAPIIQSFAKYVLRTTGKKIVYSYDGLYMKNVMDELKLKIQNGELIEKPVTLKTRLLMEKRYGVTTREQIALETYFDGLNEPMEIDHPLLDAHVPTVNKVHHLNYTCAYDERDLYYPPIIRDLVPVLRDPKSVMPVAHNSTQVNLISVCGDSAY